VHLLMCNIQRIFKVHGTTIKITSVYYTNRQICHKFYVLFVEFIYMICTNLRTATVPFTACSIWSRVASTRTARFSN